MLNSVLAAQAIINAWDNWTDEAADQSDNILHAAIDYAKALVDNAPHQIPEDARPHFLTAWAVVTDGRAAFSALPTPNLTFDEAFEPLRRFVREQTTPQPLHKILGPTENVGSTPGVPKTARPLGEILNEK